MEPQRMFRENTAPIKIEWKKTDGGYRPHHLFYDTETSQHGTEEIRLGSTLDHEISRKRHCVGYFTSARELTPCKHDRSIASGEQCDDCRQRDFFMPLRRGYDRLRERNDYYSSPFSVYIAVFGDVPKVGITRRDRFFRRVIEQGADAATVIYRAPHADEALEGEAQIAKSTSIVDRIKKATKIDNVETDVDLDVFDDSRAEIEAKTNIDTEENTVYRLNEHYPGGSDLQGRYTCFDGEYPTGEITAIKGQLVFSSSRQAISIQSVSGRIVKPTRQSRLGTYG